MSCERGFARKRQGVGVAYMCEFPPESGNLGDSGVLHVGTGKLGCSVSCN